MAVTQDELYAALDLDLSWSEAELPERERTKHVHRLHPYHGKFIPQLVEVLLDRYLAPGDHILDPFAGSGTTLVQALESGLDATGVDIAAFNCLLMRVKTAPYDLAELGQELRDVAARVESLPQRGARASGYLRRPEAGTPAVDCARVGVDVRRVDALAVPQRQHPLQHGRQRFGHGKILERARQPLEAAVADRDDVEACLELGRLGVRREPRLGCSS